MSVNYCLSFFVFLLFSAVIAPADTQQPGVDSTRGSTSNLFDVLQGGGGTLMRPLRILSAAASLVLLVQKITAQAVGRSSNGSAPAKATTATLLKEDYFLQRWCVYEI